ncbi:AraC family transcriptional regulator [Kineococcus sp. SYSU DK004]|uniref:AraC family transcriptional regulator n=1 Tax=Kineococcus sp. SYSU DK004 TaxID=3383125 RepID=UPI003D7E840D
MATRARDWGAGGRVAAAWGCKDARHFARRFRDQYGMSPREWQQHCVASSTGK